MNSTVKFPAAHFRRRPSFSSSSLRTWVLLTSLASVFTMGVARPHQDFPIAAEDQHYDFRSDGTYSFSYDTGGGEHQSFRIETRDATGLVSGRYGYIDPDGALRITNYQADSTGYRANMLIYRKVTSPPPEPLLVGPLPRRVPDLDSGVAARSNPQQTSNGPIGPVPFFPPDKPVLIIGPLPKPLQPPRGEDDFDPNEDFDFDASQGVSLSSSAQDAPQDISSVIKDVPQGPPPSNIPSGLLETILQDNFNRIFQGPLPNFFLNPGRGNSQDIVFNSLREDVGGDGFRPTSSQEDLVRISQELLQGPEVIVDTTSERKDTKSLPLRPLRVNRTRSNSKEDRVVRAPPVDPVRVSAVTTRPTSPPDLDTTFDVFIKIVTDSPNLNFTQERQNNSMAKNDDANIATPFIPLKKKDMSDTRPTLRGTFAFPLLPEIKREKVSRPDTGRASSVAVPINLPPMLPRTYLPADSTKIPVFSTFVGPLPDY